MKKETFFGHNIFSTILSEKSISNYQIIKEFEDNATHYVFTHFINNRWENIYLNPSFIPSVKPLLSQIISISLKLYHAQLKPHQTLFIPHELLGFEKNEFWFNAAGPGESTDVHNHNGKALVSGVFYLRVPDNSGNIFFKNGKKGEFELQAKEGKLILFPAELDHYVPKNQSDEKRISLGFNCYVGPMQGMN